MKKVLSIALAFLLAFIFIGSHNPRLKPFFDIFERKTTEVSTPVQQPANSNTAEDTEKPEFKIGKDTFIITAEDDPDTQLEVTYYSDFCFLSDTDIIVLDNSIEAITNQIELYKNNDIVFSEKFYKFKDFGRTGLKLTLYKDISAEDIYNSKINDPASKQIMTYSDMVTYKVEDREYKYFEASFNDNPENKAYRFCSTEIENCTLLFQITTMYKGNIAEMCDTVIADYKFL